VIHESQVRRSIVVELGWVSDEVAEVFMQEGVVGFDAGFELVMAVVKRVGGFEEAFLEVVMLNRDDRSGVLI
jgi:hypothetical protein